MQRANKWDRENAVAREMANRKLSAVLAADVSQSVKIDQERLFS